MWGAQCTRKGRVVYSRKKHPWSTRDLLRVLFEADASAGWLVAVIMIASLKFGDLVHGAGRGSGLEVLDDPHLLLNAIDQLSRTKEATAFRQKYPMRAAQLTVIIEGWRGYLAIKAVEEAVPTVE